MNKKNLMQAGKAFIGLSCAFLFFFQCKSGTETQPTPPPTLELLYPKGGETFKVGDTVTVKWTIHDQTAFKAVGISYSLDSGKTVPTTQLILNPKPPFGSFTYPDTMYTWVIDSLYISNKFVLVIWDYNGACISGSSKCSNPYHDKSAPFVIH
jgi:hypothetical protein